MASITITVGPVTATRTYADDARAGQVLGLFADAVGIPGNLGAQARLGAVVDELARIIVHRARNQHVAAAAATAEGEAQGIGMG